MKRKNRRNRGGTLIVVFLCVAFVFALLWFGANGLEKLMHYGESATIGNDPVVEAPVQEEEPVETKEEEVLPKNLYNADGFYEKNGIRYYHGGDYIGVPGIDVSSYQKDVDWNAVKEAGIEFAIIRVGYRGYKSGNLDLDACFVSHIEGALAAGLDVGVYFFSQALTVEEAEQEADYVLEQIKPYPITYPVVFDWEEIDHSDEARTEEMNMVMLTSCAEAFCSVVEEAGYTPCVYFNQTYGYQQFNLISLKDYWFWLAEYDTHPSFAYQFQMWQYTNEGSVSGIDGPVDMNVAFRKKS